MKREDLVESMTQSLLNRLAGLVTEGMRFADSPYTKTLLKRGPIKVMTDGKGAIGVFKGKNLVLAGDFDAGADAFFISPPGEKGQKSFDTVDELAAYAAKNA